MTLCLWGAFSLLGCTTPVRPEPERRGELERPVVVIGGFVDPILAANGIGQWIKQETGDGRVLATSPGLALSFDAAADHVIDQVERAFPDDDPHATTEVDVIGYSMGGLIARHAAVSGNGTGQRLRIGTLYTISTPHTGAQGANRFGFIGTALAMRSGSAFLRRLSNREETQGQRFELVAYARERDLTVGAGAALPQSLSGRLIWLSTPWYTTGHTLSFADERILRDIHRRLTAGGVAGDSKGSATRPGR